MNPEPHRSKMIKAWEESLPDVDIDDMDWDCPEDELEDREREEAVLTRHITEFGPNNTCQIQLAAVRKRILWLQGLVWVRKA